MHKVLYLDTKNSADPKSQQAKFIENHCKIDAQLLVIIMISSDDVPELLSSFPPVEFAFAYGSGVVEQGGYSYSNVEPCKLPMLDLILVVDNAEQWHTDNRVMNDDHYTPMLPLGSKYIARFQERIPAHLWFNAYVPMTSKNFKGRLMKYGVISKEHLLTDLTSWTNLYTAGRLQKPVHVLKDNELIRTAMNKNLESAVRTSLLMLPTQFEEIDLYLSIASLSYVGDPRMYLGENPKKVPLSLYCTALYYTTPPYLPPSPYCAALILLLYCYPIV